MGKIFDPAFMLQSTQEILTALPVTLFLAFIAAGIGLVIAFAVALTRYFKVRVLSDICKVYVSYIRGTPALVQIMLVYFGIPLILRVLNEYLGTSFNVNGVPRMVFAIVALSFNAGAYMSETIRSALLAVDVGQLEAAYSVNMSVRQALVRIVIPQAFAVAIPPLANTLVSLIKETSLVFTIRSSTSWRGPGLSAPGAIVFLRFTWWFRLSTGLSVPESPGSWGWPKNGPADTNGAWPHDTAGTHQQVLWWQSRIT